MASTRNVLRNCDKFPAKGCGKAPVGGASLFALWTVLARALPISGLAHGGGGCSDETRPRGKLFRWDTGGTLCPTLRERGELWS